MYKNQIHMKSITMKYIASMNNCRALSSWPTCFLLTKASERSFGTTEELSNYTYLHGKHFQKDGKC